MPPIDFSQIIASLDPDFKTMFGATITSVCGVAHGHNKKHGLNLFAGADAPAAKQPVANPYKKVNGDSVSK